MIGKGFSDNASIERLAQENCAAAMDEKDGAVLAEVNRAKDAREIGRVESGIDNAGKCPVGIVQPTRSGEQPLVGKQRMNGCRNEELAVTIVDLRDEVRSVGDVR